MTVKRPTRRAFLSAVGVAGGAGVLYGTMEALGLLPSGWPAPYHPPRRSDFALSGRSGKRVLILGAGIAGLTVAYELGKAGYQCRVLEARARPGGRNWTVRGGTTETDLDGRTQTATFAPGQYMNAGPARIAQNMVTLEYCRELGVPVEPFINANANAYYFNEAVGALSGTPIQHRTARADVYGYVSELLAKATDQGALDSLLSGDDKERLLDFLEDFGDIGPRVPGNPAASWLYEGSSRRGYAVQPGAGTQAGQPTRPAYSLTDVFASGVGRYIPFDFSYEQATPMFQPVGGMDRIPYALEAAVGASNIQYDAEVRWIGNAGSGVQVTYVAQDGRRQTVSADFCICTIPPQVLKGVPSNFSRPVLDALAYAVPLSVGKLGLQYRSRWWEEDRQIYGGVTDTNMDLRQIWYPSYGFHGEKGVVLGYYHLDKHAERYAALTPQQRIARAVAQGVKIHGEKYRTELETGFSVAWQRTRYSEGGWVTWRSRTSGQYQLLLQPEGNVYFAGDYLSYYNSWQAGAFESARKLVTDLHRRVLAEPRAA